MTRIQPAPSRRQATICPELAGPQGAVKFTGKVDGKKLSWSYQMDYNGSPLTMNYEATLDSGKMTGTVSVDPFGVSGDMSAVPATDAAPAVAPAPAAAAGSPAAAPSRAIPASMVS